MQFKFVRSFLLPAALFGASDASGAVFQSPGASEDLFQAQTLSCSFPEFASADWENGTLSTRMRGGQDFTVIFDRIDLAANTARILGATADASLGLIKGGTSISLVEITPAGTLNVTTIFTHLDRDRRFAAVQSRHLSIGGPLVSQNYGSCEVLR